MILFCFFFIVFFSNLSRSINEEDINNSFEERDERVVSYNSKCSEETEDDNSISKIETLLVSRAGQELI